MNRISRSLGILLPLTLALAGCGGSGMGGLVTGPHGDGSIPLGRARGNAGRTAIVDIKFTDGSHLSVEAATNGIVSVPSSIPDGPYQIAVSSVGTEHPVSFNEDPKTHKTYLFDVTLLPEARKADVTSVSLGPTSELVVKLGTTVKLKPVISGTNTGGLQPTYWTSGGVGEISSAGTFKAVELGPGAVSVDVLGFTDTVPVVVVP